MQLSEYLKIDIGLSDELIVKIDEAYSYEELPKGYKLLLPFNNSRKIFFIEKGLARTFYVKDGRDITHFFSSENNFTGSLDSIFYKQESPYGIELLEPSIVRSIDYQVMEGFVSDSVELNNMFRHNLIKLTKCFSDRLYSIQFQNASERYNSMLKVIPDIFSRAPLGHIASYIGITQQTLSVIRGKK